MQNALSPLEYSMVQGVFRSLTQAAWFDRTDANEDECARMVLLIHSSGIDTAQALHQACEPQARARFAKSRPIQGLVQAEPKPPAAQGPPA